MFVFFSGSMGSKDSTTRGVTLFGGDTVFSGSTGFTNIAAANNIVATGSLIAGGNVIKNSNGDTNIKFSATNNRVLFADAHSDVSNSTVQSRIDVRLNDNTPYDTATGTTFANYNIALRNHSLSNNAFAGIAFDVQEEDTSTNTIGASIVATRDTCLLYTSDAADE